MGDAALPRHRSVYTENMTMELNKREMLCICLQAIVSTEICINKLKS